MIQRLFRITLTLSVLLSASLSQAETQFVSRNSLGLGFTDNANLETEEKNPDFFYTLRTGNRFRHERLNLGLSLHATDYFKESINDALSWRTLASYEVVDRWSLEGAVFGLKFLRGEPGFSEASFNYVGFGLAAEKEISLGASTDLTYRPFYEYRSYSSLEGRKDHTIAFQGTLSFEANDAWTFDTHGEFGRIFSNQGEFDHRYFEVGTRSDYELTSDLSLGGDLGFRIANYMNRLLTETTVISKRRNRRLAASTTNSEKLTDFYLSAGLKYSITQKLDINGTWTLTSRQSRSDNQNFKVNEILALLVFTL